MAFIVIALLAAVTLGVRNELVAVTARSEARVDVVRVMAKHPLDFTTLKLEGPPRIVLDLPEAELGKAPAEVRMNDGLVRSIRAAVYGAGATAITRVVIELSEEAQFDVVALGVAIEVRVVRPPVVAKAKAAEETHALVEKKAADEEARRVLQVRADEEARVIAEKKVADEARIALEKRAAEEEVRRAAQAKVAEEARVIAEKTGADEARIALEKRAAEEEVRRAAQAKVAEEARVIAEKKGADEARIALEKKAAEEEVRRAAQAKVAEEARVIAEKKAADEARIALEEKAVEEEARRVLQVRADEEARVTADQKAADQARAIESARLREVAARATLPTVTLLAQVAPAEESPADIVSAPHVTSSGEIVGIGFRSSGAIAHITIRTSGQLPFTIRDLSPTCVAIDFPGARIPVATNRLPLDTGYFASKVKGVRPHVDGRGASVEIDLKSPGRISTAQDRRELTLDVE